MIVGSIAYGERTYENGDHAEDAIFTSKEIDSVTGSTTSMLVGTTPLWEDS